MPELHSPILGGELCTEIKREDVWFCKECNIAWTRRPGAAAEISCHGYVSGWFESIDR